jgi:hypothetical protein
MLSIVAIADLLVENANTFYVADASVLGGARIVQKNINGAWYWGSGSITLGVGVAMNSLSQAPNGDILVGDTNGRVYLSTDGGAIYAVNGVAGPLGATIGAGATVVTAFDANYDTNGIVYAGASNGAAVGIWRLQITATTTAASLWTQLDADAATAGFQPATVMDIVISPEGILYAADSTGAAAGPPQLGGIVRSVNPADGDPGVDTIFGTADDVSAPPTFEIVSTGDGLIAGYTLQSLALAPGSNILLAIENSGGAGANRIQTYSDTMTVPPTSDLRGPSTPFQPSTYTTNLTTTTTATFYWWAVDGATTYRVQCNTSPAFGAATAIAIADVAQPAMVPGEVTMVYAFPAGLAPGTKYYWRYRVQTPVIGPWADAWSIRTALTAPGVPGTAFVPAAGSINIAITPTFTWPAVVAPLGYEFQLADNPFFALPLITFSGAAQALKSNVYVLPQEDALEYSTTYYWQVRALSADTTSAWSGGSFTTVAEPAEQLPPVIVEENPPPPAPILDITEEDVTPGYIYAIIAIGAVLVIAVLVLIIRTRRV